MASARDLTAQLLSMGAVQGVVQVEWNQEGLAPSTLLADVGVCPQCTVVVVPHEKEITRLGQALWDAAKGGDLESAERLLEEGAEVGWINLSVSIYSTLI
eukprot:Hpha_TRINITY_DN28469_c0_g1::TRINITY_DN28469_c0_g1_i1::g.183940::m.183940